MTSFINKPKKTNFMSDYNFKVYSIISTIAILISLIFSTMSGEENDRYFMQAMPYYIFSFTILLDLFKKLPKQIHEEIV